MTATRLKPVLNRGENAVLDIARAVCEATGAEAFAKIRMADVVRIEGSGISDQLYRYALSAHFDVLVTKDNLAYLAIEFDGAGHNIQNDLKKAEICDRFGIPLVRVTENHLGTKLFEDTAVGFFIWQLFCVDMFLAEYANDPYEPYDPEFFISVPGKSREWPFNYAGRWRAKLNRPFAQNLHLFDNEDLSVSYSYGLLQMGTVTFTYRRGLEFRSVYAQLVGADRAVFGEAELSVEVAGLSGRRLELFGEISSFVEGIAAEQMYLQAHRFLERATNTVSPHDLWQKRDEWETDGFQLRRGFSCSSSTRANPFGYRLSRPNTPADEGSS
ncbi:MAG: DUF2726 domain-containing protein [Acidobacteriaceae bacterium]